MGDADEEDLAVAGHGVNFDASSDDSCLDDIETELYSQIYYASGNNSAVCGGPAASTSGASQLDMVTTGNSSSYPANGTDCFNSESVTTGQNVSVDPCTSRDEPAASFELDGNKLSGLGLPDGDPGSAEDPDEYIILSSDGDSSSSSARQGLSSADSCLVINSEDSDVYAVDDDCEFEFNILSEVPKCPAPIGTLDDVLAGLPAHGWHIISADKYPNTSRSRYYNVQCRNCNEKGHVASECRKPKKVDVCVLCGIRGHTSWSCKQQLCVNCCQFGHAYSSCSSPHRKHLFCQRCRRRGHAEKACAELWRQFHWAVRPEAFNNVACKPPVKSRVNKLRYCANCARRGHFTFECRAAWSNPFRPPLSVFVNEYKNQQHGGKPVSEAARKPRPSAVKSKHHSMSADRGDDGSGPRSPKGSVQRRASMGCVAELENGSTGGPSPGGRKQKQRMRVEEVELYEAKRARKESRALSEWLDGPAFPRDQDTAQWATRDRRRGGSRGDDSTVSDGLLAASTPIIRPWEHHQPHDGGSARSQAGQKSRPSVRQTGGAAAAEAPTGNGSLSRGNAVAYPGQQQRMHAVKGNAAVWQQWQGERVSGKRRQTADVAGHAGGPPAKRPRVEPGRSAGAGGRGGKQQRRHRTSSAAAAAGATGQGHGADEAGECGSTGSSAWKPKKEPANAKSTKQKHFSPAHEEGTAEAVRRDGKQSSQGAQNRKRRRQESAGSSAGAARLPVRTKKKPKSVKHCFTVTDGGITSFHVRTPTKHIVRFSY